MRDMLPISLTVLFLVSSACNAAVPTPPITVSGSGAHSAAVGINTGTINSPYTESITNTNVSTTNVTSLNAEEEKWALAQRIMLQITNPTSIALTKVQWQMWLGEREPYMTIYLKNTSHMPASSVKVTILDPASGKTYKTLKPFRFLKTSRTMQALGGAISIEAQIETREPLLAMSDIGNVYPKLLTQFPDACIFGATLDPNDLDIPLSGSYNPHTATLPFLARISYNDAFGGQSVQTQWIYAKALLEWNKNFVPTDGETDPGSVCDPTGPKNSIVINPAN
jgi:hypothetical protein